jgi:hypothetical protein
VGKYSAERKRGLKPPWPKGVSGNAGGRPHKLAITDRQQARLEDKAPTALIQRYNTQFPCPTCAIEITDPKTGNVRMAGTGKSKSGKQCRVCHGKKFERVLPDDATNGDVMVWRNTLDAMMGEGAKLRDIADRGEGTPRQRIEVFTPENKEIRLRVIYDQEESKNLEPGTEDND